jgi:hypothetical protein
MFIGSERVLDVPHHIARVRMADFVHGDALNRVSNAAYQQGLEKVMRVGPVGDVPGASKLVRVLFLEPADRGDVLTVAFRWEAAGMATSLFPVLDADMALSSYGEQRTLLAFAGSYRVPLGRLGAGLDKAILHRLATATVRALLTEVGDMLVNPAEATSGHFPYVLRANPI